MQTVFKPFKIMFQNPKSLWISVPIRRGKRQKQYRYMTDINYCAASKAKTAYWPRMSNKHTFLNHFPVLSSNSPVIHQIWSGSFFMDIKLYPMKNMPRKMKAI